MKTISDPKYKNIRQSLRNNMPEPEKKLWQHLKCKQFYGFKFRRQQSFLSYIVDFYCAELKLVVEIDGNSHYDVDAAEKDVKRDRELNNLGLKVLRFTNEDVSKNIEGVLAELKTQTTPSPSLSKEGK